MNRKKYEVLIKPYHCISVIGRELVEQKRCEASDDKIKLSC